MMLRNCSFASEAMRSSEVDFGYPGWSPPPSVAPSNPHPQFRTNLAELGQQFASLGELRVRVGRCRPSFGRTELSPNPARPSVLNILVRPSKSVFALGPLAGGRLTLTPQTSRFVCFAMPVGSAAEIDAPIDLGGRKVYAQSLVKSDAVVRSTPPNSLSVLGSGRNSSRRYGAPRRSRHRGPPLAMGVARLDRGAAVGKEGRGPGQPSATEPDTGRERRARQEPSAPAPLGKRPSG